ncbi:MAG: type II toxin-antitoxin system RelE/ParE family toxin [Acidobacteria bacterium]|nr:MAG: type II toxin-antitoxin system RelE/ParE family toxin [Acidobacteriota bacterium]
MVQLVWTAAGARDLTRIRRFLGARDEASARRAAKTIRDSVRRLARFPALGRTVEELPPEFREWFGPFGDSGYLVLYRLSGDRVSIVAVRHGRERSYATDEAATR